MENVPIVDLAGDRETAVATVDLALRHFGFFYVTNHGIDSALLQKQFDVAAELFALPLEEKLSMPFDPELDIGYVGSGVQSLDPDGNVQHSGDTKEQLMMTNNILISDPTWSIDPSDVFRGSKNYTPPVADHKETAKAYISAAFILNKKLNGLLFDALSLDEASRIQLGKEPFVVLKQMRYAGDISDPVAGKFGAGAHTDWGSFTILATDETPGLQIQMGDNRWLPVPPKPDCLIINSGDLIARLTNDYYRSAMHRVVTESTKPRYSTAVFTYFGMHAAVGPLPQFLCDERPARYDSQTTTDYFHFKLKESMGSG
jgi:isopenicillin N synthase-like dioxygenase